MALGVPVALGLEPAVALGVEPPDPPPNFPDDVPEGFALPPLAAEDDPGADGELFEEVDPDGAEVPDLPVPPPNVPPLEDFEPEDEGAGFDEPPDGRALPPEEGREEPPADGRLPPPLDRPPPPEPPRRCASRLPGRQSRPRITSTDNHREFGMMNSPIEVERCKSVAVGPNRDGDRLQNTRFSSLSTLSRLVQTSG